MSERRTVQVPTALLPLAWFALGYVATSLWDLIGGDVYVPSSVGEVFSCVWAGATLHYAIELCPQWWGTRDSTLPTESDVRITCGFVHFTGLIAPVVGPIVVLNTSSADGRRVKVHTVAAALNGAAWIAALIVARVLADQITFFGLGPTTAAALVNALIVATAAILTAANHRRAQAGRRPLIVGCPAPAGVWARASGR